MTALMPPSRPSRVPRSPRVISRPPAKRRIVRGSASRNAAMVRSASAAGRTGWSPKGVPGPRVEEVQRHLVRVERGQLGGELGALLEGFAHADDAAAADLHAGVAHHAQGLPALLPGVGGDDLREVRAGGLEVVVVAVHAHRGEVVDLLLGEHPERRGDVDVDGLLDRGDGFAHLGHQPLVRTAHGGDDAELRRAGRGGLRRRPRPARGCRARRRARGRRTGRTGEQKWQSSGQPPVLTDTMPSTSTSGPHQRMRTSWARASSSGTPVVGQLQDGERPGPRRGRPRARAPARGPRRAGRRLRAPRRPPTCRSQVSSVGGRAAGVQPAARRRKSAASKVPPSSGPSPARAAREEGVGRRASRRRPRMAPASGRAARVSRSRTLHRAARSGSSGQAPITTPAELEPAVGHRLQRERRVVERAQASGA